MNTINVKLLKSVNDVDFGTSRMVVRRKFDSKYEEFPKNMLNDKEIKESFNKIAKKMATLAGKSVEEFLNNIPEVPQQIFDAYEFGHILFDEHFKFVAYEVSIDDGCKLFVEGKQYILSNRKQYILSNIKDLLTLADDFTWDADNTTWISFLKQIGIWCPDGKDRVSSILFGCSGYYTKD